MTTGMWLLILLVFVVIILLPKGSKRVRPTSSPTKVDLSKYGECVWMDEEKTKPLFNNRFRVYGKPDAIYRNVIGEYIAVEYKSRSSSKVYQSDILQAKAAALAARGDMNTSFKISKVVVITPQESKEVDLPDSDFALYEQISRNVEAVQHIKKGGRGHKTTFSNRCNNCGFKYTCQTQRL